MPWLCAQAFKAFASAKVKISFWSSFWPIIGVKPTFCHSELSDK